MIKVWPSRDFSALSQHCPSQKAFASLGLEPLPCAHPAPGACRSQCRSLGAHFGRSPFRTAILYHHFRVLLKGVSKLKCCLSLLPWEIRASSQALEACPAPGSTSLSMSDLKVECQHFLSKYPLFFQKGTAGALHFKQGVL